MYWHTPGGFIRPHSHLAAQWPQDATGQEECEVEEPLERKEWHGKSKKVDGDVQVNEVVLRKCG